MNEEEQGALEDSELMPGNHGSPHQSFLKLYPLPMSRR